MANGSIKFDEGLAPIKFEGELAPIRFELGPEEEKPGTVLGTMQRSLQAIGAGAMGGIESFAKEAALAPRLAGAPSTSLLEPAVTWLGEAREALEPEKPGYWEQALQSTAQSGMTMLPALIGRRGIRAKVGRAIAFKGLTFGAAEAYDFLNDIRANAAINGATAAEMEQIERQAIPQALLYGSFEMTGEIATDLVSAYLFGIFMNPAISGPVKSGIKSFVKDFIVRTGKAIPPEILGEEFTAVGEFKIRKEAGLTFPGEEIPLKETAIVTALQTFFIGMAATPAGRYQLRHAEELAKDIAKKMRIPEEIVKREISKVEQLTAGYTTGKEKVADAIKSIDERKTKKGKKKKEVKEHAEGLREPEGGLPERRDVAEVSKEARREGVQLEQGAGPRGVPGEVAPRKKKGRKAQRKEEVVNVSPEGSLDVIEPLPAVRTKDGKVYASGVPEEGGGHPSVLEKGNISPESVKDEGWLVKGQYFTDQESAVAEYGRLKKIEKAALAEPTEKEKAERALMDLPLYAEVQAAGDAVVAFQSVDPNRYEKNPNYDQDLRDLSARHSELNAQLMKTPEMRRYLELSGEEHTRSERLDIQAALDSIDIQVEGLLETPGNEGMAEETITGLIEDAKVNPYIVGEKYYPKLRKELKKAHKEFGGDLNRALAAVSEAEKVFKARGEVKAEEPPTPAPPEIAKPGPVLPAEGAPPLVQILDKGPTGGIGPQELESISLESPDKILLYKSKLTRDRHYVTAKQAQEMAKSGDVSEVWEPDQLPTGEDIFNQLNRRQQMGGRFPLSQFEQELLASWVNKNQIANQWVGKIEKIWTGDIEAILGYVRPPGGGSPVYIVQDTKTGMFGIHATTPSEKSIVGELSQTKFLVEKTGPLAELKSEDRSTFELTKKYTVSTAASKLLSGNAASRQAAHRKAQAAVEAKLITPEALADAIVEEMGNVARAEAQKSVAEGKPFSEQDALDRLKTVEKIGDELRQKLGLAVLRQAEPTMEEAKKVPALTVKRVQEAIKDIRKGDAVLYENIVERLDEGESVETVTDRYKDRLANFFLEEDQMPKVVQAIGLKAKVISPMDILLGRQIAQEEEEGKLYDRLVDEGKTDEEIEEILQERRGVTNEEGKVGLTPAGSEVLETLIDEEQAEKSKIEAPPAKETKRQKIVRKAKEKRAGVVKAPEAGEASKIMTAEETTLGHQDNKSIKFFDQNNNEVGHIYFHVEKFTGRVTVGEARFRTQEEYDAAKALISSERNYGWIKQWDESKTIQKTIGPYEKAVLPTAVIRPSVAEHPMYLDPKTAASQVNLLKGRIRPDSPLETRIMAIRAHLNNTFHTHGDLNIMADQLMRTIAQLNEQRSKSYGDRSLPLMEIEDALLQLGQLSELIGEMRGIGVTPIERAKKILKSEGGYITKGGRNVPVHGADIEDLEGILQGGLRAGSAIDTTDKMEWASEYPVIIEVPGARKGTYVPHNQYWTTSNDTMPTKVTLKLADYIPRVQNKYRAMFNALKEKYPNVRFVIKDDPGPWRPNIDQIVKNLERVTAELDALESPTAEVTPLEAERDAIMNKYLVGERTYNTTGMPKEERARVQEIENEVKSIRKRYDRSSRILQWELDDLMADYDAATGLDTKQEGPTVDFLGFQQVYDYLANFARQVRKRSHRTIRTISALEGTPLKGSGVHAGVVSIGRGEIGIEKKTPDTNILSSIFFGPMAVAERLEKKTGDPLATNVIAGIIHGVDAHKFMTANDALELERSRDGLNKKDRRELTADMKEIEMGETVKMRPKIRAAAERIKELFDSIRERYKESRRVLLFDSMNSTEQDIMDKIFKGADAVETVARYNKIAGTFNTKQKNAGSKERMPTTTYEVIKSYLNHLEELDNWGWENYITHAMKGNIAIVDEKGNVVSVAQTTEQAIQRARDFIRSKPSTDTLTIKYDHWLNYETPIKLGKKQISYLQGIVARAVNKEVQEIEKGLNVHIAKRALGKVVTVKPGFVFSPYVQERQDILPGEEDIFDILGAYIYKMNKKIALDPIIQYFQNNYSKLGNQPKLRKMITDQIEAAKGKYWLEDRIADEVLKIAGMGVTKALSKVGVRYHPTWGERGFAASKGIGFLTSTEANLKFAYRPIAALLNRMSGLGHTWVKTSASYVHQARKFLRTEEGRQFMENHAADLGTALVEEVKGRIELKTPAWKPTYLFQSAEKPNRAESYVASYLWATDKLGYDAEKAREFARRSVWLQQFNYNVAAIPAAFRSPLGRGIFQFKTYLMGELHFIASLRTPQEWAKYLAMQFVLGGPKGVAISIKSFPLIAAASFLLQAIRGGADWYEEFENFCNTRIPRFYRGMWGYFGIDASLPASFQFPEDFSDYVGVIGSDLVKIKRAVFDSLGKGEKYVKWRLFNLSRDMIPIWRYWSDLWLSFYNFPGIPGRDGEVWDSKGRFLHKLEPLDVIREVGGAGSLAQSIVRTSERMQTRMQERDRAQAASVIRHIVMSRKKFDADLLTDKLYNDLSALVMDANTILQAIETASLPADVRSILRARMSMKLGAVEERRRLNEAMHELGYDTYSFD